MPFARMAYLVFNFLCRLAAAAQFRNVKTGSITESFLDLVMSLFAPFPNTVGILFGSGGHFSWRNIGLNQMESVRWFEFSDASLIFSNSEGVFAYCLAPCFAAKCESKYREPPFKYLFNTRSSASAGKPVLGQALTCLESHSQ